MVFSPPSQESPPPTRRTRRAWSPHPCGESARFSRRHVVLHVSACATTPRRLRLAAPRSISYAQRLGYTRMAQDRKVSHKPFADNLSSVPFSETGHTGMCWVRRPPRAIQASLSLTSLGNRSHEGMQARALRYAVCALGAPGETFPRGGKENPRSRRSAEALGPRGVRSSSCTPTYSCDVLP